MIRQRSRNEVLEALARHWTLRPRDLAVALIVSAAAVGASLALLSGAVAAMAEVLRLAGHPLGSAGHALAAVWRWLPLPLVMIEGLAVFLLGAAAGFAFAQGSHGTRGSVDYRLARLYDDLSERGWRNLAARIPMTARDTAQEFARSLRALQFRHAAMQSGRREALDVARRLRQPVASGEPTDPAQLELADRIESALGVRRLVATLPTVEAALAPGRLYALELHFAPIPAPEQRVDVLPPRNLEEAAEGRTLRLSLFGTGVQAEPTQLSVLLPREGPSTAATATIVAAPGPQCALDIYVMEAGSTDVLQTLRLQLPVVLPS
ncbi:hypothetical protein [Thauera sinica]|uniref:Transmembrane protein n=1 Tax=Thauera sinica TaxID=2665146 RepID=A0ABW1AR18_9RHOO|nr:hypothetical protein [Thauera sp. K11]ATE59007.1 hypothetical protein CCZ27_02670 [Thauera sp. K11]